MPYVMFLLQPINSYSILNISYFKYDPNVYRKAILEFKQGWICILGVSFVATRAFVDTGLNLVEACMNTYAKKYVSQGKRCLFYLTCSVPELVLK